MPRTKGRSFSSSLTMRTQPHPPHFLAVQSWASHTTHHSGRAAVQRTDDQSGRVQLSTTPQVMAKKCHVCRRLIGSLFSASNPCGGSDPSSYMYVVVGMVSQKSYIMLPLPPYVLLPPIFSQRCRASALHPLPSTKRSLYAYATIIGFFYIAGNCTASQFKCRRLAERMQE
ncbi:hypothetical protein IWZ03DRAFT_179610 [Phyllosticta citriasiana]|uniref:Uncharacterized protein n=1 Tax=Phyllosticta citriasiana TaxID=595635 RepID=A0ABR1KMM9_9PEZI